MIKYTKEELQKMSMKRLQSLDITTKDEENLVQGVINSKTGITNNPIKFDYSKVPDIKNVEQEKEWQKKVDEFNEKNLPVEAKIVQAEKELETINKEVVDEKPVVQIIEVDTKGEIIKPFCDKCTSKGVRHKKECPLYVPTIKQNADDSSQSA